MHTYSRFCSQSRPHSLGSWCWVAFLLMAPAVFAQSEEKPKVEKDWLPHAEALIGHEFTEQERELMLPNLVDQLEAYMALRAKSISNSVRPSLFFNPLPVGFTPQLEGKEPRFDIPRGTSLPKDLNELAYAPVTVLADLIRSRQVTSVQLTELFLGRLKKYDPKIHCVITLLEDRAMNQARKADRELAAGIYRGPLHGIPYGAKDLLATPGNKTTWGAKPYQDQVIHEQATVIAKLEAAGAVLLAKLSLGALAWGDVWYGEQTRNPWNLEQGSSGSSAGSAAATSAGLVPFAIGTETYGSIVSPSTRCGVTGLRPTFGRVSRHGAMALSWSMDKIGPICRTVEDCAIVFNTIRGADGIDQHVREAAFAYDSSRPLSSFRIGYLKQAFESASPFKEADQAVLKTLKDLGANLIPIEIPDYPYAAMSIILSAEAATAFDDLTLSNQDDTLVRQVRNAWPNVFRAARSIPAVEYLQANRLRFQLIQDMQKVMNQVDVYVSPSFSSWNLLMTNLTGHPCISVPTSVSETGKSSITFVAGLFDEASLLSVAKAYQQSNEVYLANPPQFP